MGLFIDKLKVKATASSMHQFCPVVRSVFPEEPTDEVVETITLFLYLNLVQEVFGKRFTKAVAQRLRRCLKFVRLDDAVSRLGRIRKSVSSFRGVSDSMLGGRKASPELMFQNHIASIVYTMLSEAGIESNCRDEHDHTFLRFEQAIRAIKTHLCGIRAQNHFLMSR